MLQYSEVSRCTATGVMHTNIRAVWASGGDGILSISGRWESCHCHRRQDSEGISQPGQGFGGMPVAFEGVVFCCRAHASVVRGAIA